MKIACFIDKYRWLHLGHENPHMDLDLLMIMIFLLVGSG